MKNVIKLFALMALEPIFAFLLLPPAAHAQAPAAYTPPACPNKIVACRYTEPFGIEFEGLFGFNANIEEHVDDKEYTFLLSPAIGVFVIKGLQLGLAPSFIFDIVKDGNENKTYAGGATLFGRYIFDIHSIVFPYVGARMGALGSKTENGFDRELTILNIGPEIGIKLLVAQRAIVTIFFNYMFNSMGDEPEDDWREIHNIYMGVAFGFWI
jgi:hypothetical protein